MADSDEPVIDSDEPVISVQPPIGLESTIGVIAEAENVIPITWTYAPLITTINVVPTIEMVGTIASEPIITATIITATNTLIDSTTPESYIRRHYDSNIFLSRIPRNSPDRIRIDMILLDKRKRETGSSFTPYYDEYYTLDSKDPKDKKLMEQILEIENNNPVIILAVHKSISKVSIIYKCASKYKYAARTTKPTTLATERVKSRIERIASK
jgi:hypothetical protein